METPEDHVMYWQNVNTFRHMSDYVSHVFNATLLMHLAHGRHRHMRRKGMTAWRLYESHEVDPYESLMFI